MQRRLARVLLLASLATATVAAAACGGDDATAPGGNDAGADAAGAADGAGSGDGGGGDATASDGGGGDGASRDGNGSIDAATWCTTNHAGASFCEDFDDLGADAGEVFTRWAALTDGGPNVFEYGFAPTASSTPHALAITTPLTAEDAGVWGGAQREATPQARTVVVGWDMRVRSPSLYGEALVVQLENGVEHYEVTLELPSGSMRLEETDTVNRRGPIIDVPSYSAASFASFRSLVLTLTFDALGQGTVALTIDGATALAATPLQQPYAPAMAFGNGAVKVTLLPFGIAPSSPWTIDYDDVWLDLH